MADTWDLRRRVLREGRADADVGFPEDVQPGAFHLGVRTSASGPIVGAVTFSPAAVPVPAPGWSERPAYRLRGMAVEPEHRGSGLGRRLLDAGLDRCRAAGADLVWANARDVALGFYTGQGFSVVGEGFVSIGLPHHLVVREL